MTRVLVDRRLLEDVRHHLRVTQPGFMPNPTSLIDKLDAALREETGVTVTPPQIHLHVADSGLADAALAKLIDALRQGAATGVRVVVRDAL